MKRFIIIIICIPGLFHSASSQDIPENINLEGIIYGQVIDGDSGVPIEYATIALYNMLNDEVAQGTITDKNGNFKLENISLGVYSLEITFVGYKKTRINRILIRPNKYEIFLGTIELEASVEQIEEVTITGEKQEVLYKIDRKIINISQDVAARGGSVVDALEGMPSVKTDMEGNLTLRGSSNYTVLIDGKPTPFSGSDALQQIPANAVENVEIITNPSAKYDPEGEVGIINVIMKKDFSDGVTGMVNTSYGSMQRYSADALVNFRLNDLSLFAGVDVKERPFNGNGSMYRETYAGEESYIRNSAMDIEMNRQSLSLKTGASYNFNTRNSLQWEATGGQQQIQRAFHSNITSQTDSVKYILSTSNFNREPRYLSTSFNFQHLFDLSGHKLDGEFHFSYSETDKTNQLTEKYATESWQPFNPALLEESVETGHFRDFRAQIDYIKPLKAGQKLEAGYQGRLNKHNLLQQFDGTDVSSQIDQAKENDLGISRQIHALYGLFSNENDNFGYKLGLRGEFANRNITQSQEVGGFSKIYYSLFPSIHLSRSWEETNQIQVSYSRRINRPNVNQLNPYKQFMDDKNFRQGNPELAPEYINAFEINYLKRIFFSFISIEAFYRQTTNKISPLWYPEDDDALLLTYVNLNKDFSAGVEMMAGLQLVDGLRIMAGSSLYRYSIEGDVFGSEVNNVSNSWNIRLGTTFRIEKIGTKLQFNSIYNGDKASAQGSREGFFVTMLGVQQDIIKNKLSATIQIRDLFGTMKFSSHRETDFFVSSMEFLPNTPILSFNVSYKFNNYKKSTRNMEDINELDFEDDFLY